MRVVESDPPVKITYEIVTGKGRALHRFDSSYQPEEGEMPDWSWAQSKAAAVSWSTDGRHVAIDEQNHHSIGRVFLAGLSPSAAVPIPVPEEAILAETKVAWDRERLHFDHWIGPDKVALLLAGRVNRAKGKFFQPRSFEIDLALDGAKARILPIQDPDSGTPVIALRQGINHVDLNAGATNLIVIVAHRENFNAHSFEATTIYLTTPNGLQIVPVESGGEVSPDSLVLRTSGGADSLLTDFRLLHDPDGDLGDLVTAERKFGASFADTQPVTFKFYHLTKNDSPGQAEYFFRQTGSEETVTPYADVTEAFRDELGLDHDGKPGRREQSFPDPHP